jgi:hypothetical protein
MSTKLRLSSTNFLGQKTNQLVLAKLEHSILSQIVTKQANFVICSELLPLWPWKVRQIKPGIDTQRCILVLYLCLISLVFFCFGPLVAKPRIRLDRNLLCELALPRGIVTTYVQSFRPIALSSSCRWFSNMTAWWPLPTISTNDAILNFDLCDLQK